MDTINVKNMEIDGQMMTFLEALESLIMQGADPEDAWRALRDLDSFRKGTAYIPIYPTIH